MTAAAIMSPARRTVATIAAAVMMGAGALTLGDAVRAGWDHAVGVDVTPDDDRGVFVIPADPCAPIMWAAGTNAAEWSAAIADGWRGSTTDGVEAIYPPGCLDGW